MDLKVKFYFLFHWNWVTRFHFFSFSISYVSRKKTTHMYALRCCAPFAIFFCLFHITSCRTFHSTFRRRRWCRFVKKALCIKKYQKFLFKPFSSSESFLWIFLLSGTWVFKEILVRSLARNLNKFELII